MACSPGMRRGLLLAPARFFTAFSFSSYVNMAALAVLEAWWIIEQLVLK